MEFYKVACYNMVGMAIIWLSLLMMGAVFFEKKPLLRGLSKRSFLLLLFVFLLFPVLGAASYQSGLMMLRVQEIIACYVQILYNMMFLRLLYLEEWRACWGVSVIFSILWLAAEKISFSFRTKDILYLNRMLEFLEYAFLQLALSLGVFLALLLLYKKAGVGKVFSHWLEWKRAWFFGILILSLYPLLESVYQALLSWGRVVRIWETVPMLLFLMSMALLYYMNLRQMQQQEMEAQRQSLCQQDAYIRSLEKMQEEMRQFRHDYKNMLAGMYLQAKEGDAASVLEFIQEMTDGFEQQIGGQIRQLSQLRNVHMQEVKGLLLGKLGEMQRDGIQCDFEARQPFEGARMKPVDLCRCLGILIDNAMDEVRGKEGAKVQILISSQEGCVTFLVKNTLHSAVDFHRMWEDGYSTRGEGRGVGLASYRKILDRYQNALSSTAVQDEAFVQELKIRE